MLQAHPIYLHTEVPGRVLKRHLTARLTELGAGGAARIRIRADERAVELTAPARSASQVSIQEATR